MTLSWDPKKAFAELADGRIPDTCRVYAGLLEKGPIARFENDDGSRMWGIFSHSEIEKAALDTDTFSNVTVPEGKQRIVPLMVDPPEHAGYRRLINKYFAPAPIKTAESEMRPIAIGVLDAMISRGSGDFSQEYAYPFATQTLCRYLRVKEDWTIYNDWSSEMERATGAGTRRSGGELPGADRKNHSLHSVPGERAAEQLGPRSPQRFHQGGGQRAAAR